MGPRKIDRRMDTDRTDCSTGILLLFEKGGRPDVKSVGTAVDKLCTVLVSHDPSELQPQPAPNKSMDWLELLADGLTFDLINLAPNQSANIPELRNTFDCPDDFLTAECDAICLRPGPHLSGGPGSMPIVRRMLGLAAELGSELPTLRAIFWPPAAISIGPTSFCTNVASWVAGGQFPAQCLIGFRPMNDQALQTEGLAFFTGQELRIEPDFVGDHSTATQLAIRLVQQLVQHGPLTETEDVMAPDGSQMRLKPSGNGKFVRVWRS